MTGICHRGSRNCRSFFLPEALPEIVWSVAQLRWPAGRDRQRWIPWQLETIADMPLDPVLMKASFAEQPGPNWEQPRPKRSATNCGLPVASESQWRARHGSPRHWLVPDPDSRVVSKGRNQKARSKLLRQVHLVFFIISAIFSFSSPFYFYFYLFFFYFRFSNFYSYLLFYSSLTVLHVPFFSPCIIFVAFTVFLLPILSFTSLRVAALFPFSSHNHFSFISSFHIPFPFPISLLFHFSLHFHYSSLSCF